MPYTAKILKLKRSTVLGSPAEQDFATVEGATKWMQEWERTSEGAFRWTIVGTGSDGDVSLNGHGGLRPGWTLDEDDRFVPPPLETTSKDDEGGDQPES